MSHSIQKLNTDPLRNILIKSTTQVKCTNPLGTLDNSEVVHNRQGQVEVEEIGNTIRYTFVLGYFSNN